ncbi:HAD-IIIC family phosphatase [Pseudomonas sp. NPDC007930]|uniref:HAD-IIIC family phosphatase n=1 Tax=Pseudomonas sp. NPDC007930 TaxID=3364417 RepID=UPI0036E2F235
MPISISDLPWLVRAPADFSAQCRALSADTPDLGRTLRALANCAMDGNQLQKLANALKRLQGAGAPLAPLLPVRLGVLGNGTQDFTAPALAATAARHGLALDVAQAEYDQVLQAASDEYSSLNTFAPQLVLVAVDYRGLPWQPTPGDAGAASANVEMALNYLQGVRDAVRRNSGALCIVQNLAAPAEGLFGSYDRRVPGTMLWLVDELNRRLLSSLAGSEDMLFDVAQLAASVGLDAWHSPAEWNMAKLPFASEYLPLYADHLLRIIGALRGRSRRCLILDLDNTVWGGIIGDDGLEGIRIAQGDAVGEAHLAVQRMALALRERGIVLAVSSKNTDEIARKPFREHPEMLLREEHFAVFQANWQDKASNIKAIAEALALGLDAMVFLDDNPAERGLIRQLLPQVAVPELEDDPASYARTLAAAGYFETVVFSEEDRKRAALYQENARRVTLQQQAGDVNAYLASLDMEIVFKPFDPTGRARIAQLINKSNQYNLTTRRYTEAEVAAAEQQPGAFTLQVRLLDRFGDNGMISVIICKPGEPDTWHIDTWLMSCRVLGRKVEDAVLGELISQARARGITRLVGEFIPTERNMMVKAHYPKLGFECLAEHADGTTLWALGTATATPAPHMRVRHEAL